MLLFGKRRRVEELQVPGLEKQQQKHVAVWISAQEALR